MDVLRRPDLRLTFLNLSRLAGRRSADAGGFIFFLGRPPRFWTRVDYSRKKSTRISEEQIYGGIDPPSTFFGGEEGRDKKRGEMDDSNSKICRLGFYVCALWPAARGLPSKKDEDG